MKRMLSFIDIKNSKHNPKHIDIKNSKHKEYFRKYINDYIVIVTVIMLISVLGHIMTINMTSREIAQTNNRFVLSTKSICDNYLKEAEDAAYNILNTSSLEPLFSGKIKDDKYIKSAISSLSLVIKTNPLISKAFLLMPEQNLCVSSDSVYNQKVFYDVNYQKFFSSDAECIDTLINTDVKAFKLIKAESDDEARFLFLYNFCSAYSFDAQKSVIAVFEIDFNKLIKKMNYVNSGSYAIYDSGNRLIFSENGILKKLPEFGKNSNSKTVKINGKQYISTYAVSEQFNGKYVHTVEKSVYSKTLTSINFVTASIYILCSVFALLLAFLFSKRNWLSTVNLLAKIEYSEKELHSRKDIFQRSVLINFLSGKTGIHGEAMLKADFAFPYSKYAVVIFNILDFGIGADSPSALFCISNVFDELLVGTSKNHYCEIDGFFACLVNTNEDDISDIIEEKTQFMNKFLGTNLGINFVSVSSGATSDLSEAPKLYAASLKILESRFLFNDTSSINADNIDRRITSVIKYIDDNFSDKELSVASIAEHFNLSSNYLSKCFKTNTGDGLSKYIISKRIEEAKKLLLETNEAVNKISDKTGFYSTNVFIRTFKKLEEVTPGQFRKDNK